MPPSLSPSPVPDGERAAPASPPLALTGDAPTPRVRKARPPKHTPEAIAGRDRVVDAFTTAVRTVKAIEAKVTHAADHAAAFALVKAYGADEAYAIVGRALRDDFVASKNCPLRYIASKPESFRGAATPKANGRHPLQLGAPEGQSSGWELRAEAKRRNGGAQ